MNTLDAIKKINAGESVDIPEPGVYRDIDFEEYCDWPCVNNSTLKHGYASALKLHAALEGSLSTSDTRSLSFGRASHTLLFEIDQAADRFTVEPDDLLDNLTTEKGEPTRSRNSKAFKERYAKWKAGIPEGMDILTNAEWDRLNGMLRAIRSRQDTHAACAIKGESEVSLRWDETVKVGGIELVIPMKARLDRLVKDFTGLTSVYDLKTTFRDDPYWWLQDATTKWYYQQQEATYMRGLDANGIKCAGMVFIVAQSDAPFDVYPVELGQATKASGRHDYIKHLNMIANGVATGEWPGVCSGTYEGEAPAWMLSGDPQSLTEEAA